MSKQKQPTILFRTSLRSTVLDVMDARPGWRETDSDTDWDINWSDIGWVRDYFDHMHLEDHQRINHFRNHYELTRKDLLVKNLKRMKKQLQRRCVAPPPLAPAPALPPPPCRRAAAPQSPGRPASARTPLLQLTPA